MQQYVLNKITLSVVFVVLLAVPATTFCSCLFTGVPENIQQKREPGIYEEDFLRHPSVSKQERSAVENGAQEDIALPRCASRAAAKCFWALSTPLWKTTKAVFCLHTPPKILKEEIERQAHRIN